MTHVDVTADEARTAAWWRQGGLCALCWENLPPLESGGWEGHHRLKVRYMRGHRWCPCNIVALHARCHTQGPAAVHDHPDDARRLGLILTMDQDPRDVAVQVRWPWSGDAFLNCEGMAVSTLSPHDLASPVQEPLPLT